MTTTVQLCAIHIPEGQFPVESPMDVYNMSFLNKFWKSLSPLSSESTVFDAGILKNIGVTKPYYLAKPFNGTESNYAVAILCFTDFETKIYAPIKPLAHLSWDYLFTIANKIPLGFDIYKLRQTYDSPFNWLMLTEVGVVSALEKENY